MPSANQSSSAHFENTAFPASFASDDSVVATAPDGQRGHRDHIAHTERFARKLWTVREGVWCLVGNGLSNQTFIEGPEGLIAIDTGESNEEMAAALAEVRAVTDAPVVAVIYTHFHYVAGTRAVFDEVGGTVPIWGHAGIAGNRLRVGVDLSAAAGRGLVHQFGMMLPPPNPDDAEGPPDALINSGLGLEYRSQDHAPFTDGFIPPTETFTEATSATIAGLAVEFTPAPSDADDSVTIWFPELGVCVNNIVWPALFNVFAIRGEEYRDPRILLDGIDHIAGLGAEHLVCAHGPPLSGQAEIATEVEVYRDSIQYLWDQTVRGINRGLTADELTELVQLPDDYGQSFRTQQLYGLVEHHVRQIHNGLRGWFDGDEAKLFPVPRAERCRRLIEGFGGADEVRAQARAALADDDPRWAIELATWLVHQHDNTAENIRVTRGDDASLLAEGLRMVGQRTTSANVRNWCLTRALELEKALNLSRFRMHRFGYSQVLAGDPDVFVRTLRLVLNPELSAGLNTHLAFAFDGAPATIGLHIRRAVAVPTDGEGAEGTVRCSHEAWAGLLSGRLSLDEGLAGGTVTIEGDESIVRRALACFETGAFSALGGS